MRRALALCLFGALLSGCGSEAEEAPPAPRPVLWRVVEPRAAEASRYAGTVEPRYRTELAFRVLGRMLSRDVDVGSPVRRGQRLAALDPLVYDIAVRSIQAELFKSQAQLANARAAAARQQSLVGRNAASQADLEGATETLATAEAAVARTKAGLAKAEEQLGYTRLVAETDGVVTAVGAQAGQTVTAGQSVVTVARPDVLDAVVDVPDEAVGDLKPGMTFTVVLQIAPGVTARGTVREISPQADAATRTRRVKLALDAPPTAFRVGTTVTAEAAVPHDPRIELPLSALLTTPEGTYVWIVDRRTLRVQTRPVTVASREADRFRVAGGLEAGTPVVTAGVHSLKQGQLVRLVGETAR